MKHFLLILSIFIVSVFSTNTYAGRCSGGPYCTACTNCSSCKNCSEEGGTCGVCTSYDEPDPEPESNYVPVPAAEESSSDNSESSDEYSSYYEEPEEEKSSYSWLWWTLGIIGGLAFLGSLGKK